MRPLTVVRSAFPALALVTRPSRRFPGSSAPRVLFCTRWLLESLKDVSVIADEPAASQQWTTGFLSLTTVEKKLEISGKKNSPPAPKLLPWYLNSLKAGYWAFSEPPRPCPSPAPGRTAVCSCARGLWCARGPPQDGDRLWPQPRTRWRLCPAASR